MNMKNIKVEKERKRNGRKNKSNDAYNDVSSFPFEDGEPRGEVEERIGLQERKVREK